MLARGLAGDAAVLDDAAALRLAAEIEGHPDNVAPCLLGGFTIAWAGPDGARAVRREPASGVRPMIFIPATRGVTAEARAALPASVPHADAAFNAGRAALLVHALAHEPGTLLRATEDRLHQEQRRPAMPETLALIDRLRAAGHAAVVSGAGPSVLVLTRRRPADPAEPAGAAGVGEIARLVPGGWTLLPLGVDVQGARIDRPLRQVSSA